MRKEITEKDLSSASLYDKCPYCQADLDIEGMELNYEGQETDEYECDYCGSTLHIYYEVSIDVGLDYNLDLYK